MVIVDDIPQEWWEILLLGATGVGTVGAAAIAALAVRAALRVAKDDRKAADKRAEDDRREFDRRQAEERQHDRQLADWHWRLDLLLRISEAHQEFIAADRLAFRAQHPGGGGVHIDLVRARATAEAKATALVEAYPYPLPVLQHRYRDTDVPVDPLGELMQAYSLDYVAPRTYTEEAHAEALEVAELRYNLRQVRSALMGEPFITGLSQ